MRIYHRQGAGRPIRVIWALEELDASYDLAIMTAEEAATEEHRSRHPLGRVPVLEDEDAMIFESTGICLHVAELHPDADLLRPAGTPDRALVYQWSFFAMTEIEPAVIECARRREASPDLAEAAAERAGRAVQVIDDALQGHDYLVGDRFSVADIVTSEVVRIGVRVNAIEPKGRISEYLAAMEARPARRRAVAMLV